MIWNLVVLANESQNQYINIFKENYMKYFSIVLIRKDFVLKELFTPLLYKKL